MPFGYTPTYELIKSPLMANLNPRRMKEGTATQSACVALDIGTEPPLIDF